MAPVISLKKENRWFISKFTSTAIFKCDLMLDMLNCDESKGLF